ncbi:hypothetical protein L209DRAFT_760313 [Thermothelomyces heterothallicus CBS 203.75]
MVPSGKKTTRSEQRLVGQAGRSMALGEPGPDDERGNGRERWPGCRLWFEVVVAPVDGLYGVEVDTGVAENLADVRCPRWISQPRQRRFLRRFRRRTAGLGFCRSLRMPGSKSRERCRPGMPDRKADG